MTWLSCSQGEEDDVEGTLSILIIEKKIG